MILTIERKQIPPDIEVLEMKGRITLGNDSREVELQLAHLLADHATKIIFDLSGVNILDSTGIGILVVCQGKIATAGGQMRIAGATGFVASTLHSTNVDKLIRMSPTVSAAAASF